MTQPTQESLIQKTYIEDYKEMTMQVSEHPLEMLSNKEMSFTENKYNKDVNALLLCSNVR